MIVKCEECELPVSDKALACPHCGFPMNQKTRSSTTRKSNKRRRLPNGFGQISEIKTGNLRKRFRAMVSVGKNSTGRPIVKPLKPQSYFETYNEAYEALIEYNKNPYDLNECISVKELYDRWTESYFATLKSDSSSRTIISAWAYCSSVYDMRAKDVRARHIKGCIENGTALIKGEERKPTAGVKSRIKSMFNLMLDYALEYELVEKNYARTFTLSDDVIRESEETKRGHIPFTDKEMDVLWENINDVAYVDAILFQCYSGWRPQEIGLIKLEDVDFEKGVIIGGMKTEAGTNRIVPISEKIKGIVEQKYAEAKEMNSEYLFNCTDSRNGKMLTYDKYSKRFMKIRDMLNLNPEHRAHDPRTHFVTMAKKCGMDEYALKYIVGHSITDITEKVYTKRETEWLVSEMNKIK